MFEHANEVTIIKLSIQGHGIITKIRIFVIQRNARRTTSCIQSNVPKNEQEEQKLAEGRQATRELEEQNASALERLEGAETKLQAHRISDVGTEPKCAIVENYKRPNNPKIKKFQNPKFQTIIERPFKAS